LPFYDLHTDPKEEYPLDSGGRKYLGALARRSDPLDHAASLKKEPLIKPGTPDPYTPPKP
jgi:hypothetical protein